MEGIEIREFQSQKVRLISIPGLPFGFKQASNMYIIGEDERVLIDSGSPYANIEEVLSESKESGFPFPKAVFHTHLHLDHCGNSAELKSKKGVKLFTARAEMEDAYRNLDEGLIDGWLVDGKTIEVSETRIEVCATPGHTPGHTCFYLPQEKALFSGDLIVGEGTSWVGPPSGNMRDYIKSLRKMKEKGPLTIFPGHGPPVTDGMAKIDEYLAHRKMREDQVLEAIESGYVRVREMVAKIYADYDKSLHGLAMMTVLGHLEVLMEDGKVEMEAREGGENVYRLRR